MNYKEELLKMIEYILEEELPYEKSWVYATKLKSRMEKRTMSEETNFSTVEEFLKAALTELKKGEHEQLASSLFREGPYLYKFNATIKEAIEHLISDVNIICIRWSVRKNE